MNDNSAWTKIAIFSANLVRTFRIAAFSRCLFRLFGIFWGRSLSLFPFMIIAQWTAARVGEREQSKALSLSHLLPAWGICILSEPASSQQTELRNKFLVVHGAREISPFWPPPALSLFISTGHRTHPLHLPKVKLEPNDPDCPCSKENASK